MINVLTILLDLKIKEEELPSFRGAVIAKAGASNVLFHDHTDCGLRYSYPLIQYKRIGGYAAITSLESAIPRIGGLLLDNQEAFRLRIGRRLSLVSVADVHRQSLELKVSERTAAYVIVRWLPLNQENHKKYLAIDALADRITFLESLLVGNILSFAKGVDVFLDGTISLSITDLISTQTCRFKGVDMLSFNLKFKTNVTLPEFIGLGKGVSLGFGVINCMELNNK